MIEWHGPSYRKRTDTDTDQYSELRELICEAAVPAVNWSMTWPALGSAAAGAARWGHNY